MWNKINGVWKRWLLPITNNATVAVVLGTALLTGSLAALGYLLSFTAKLWAWLSDTVTITRWQLPVEFIGGASMILVAIWWHRWRLDRERRIAEVRADVKAQMAAKLVAALGPDPSLPNINDLDAAEISLLMMLYEKYPQSLTITAVSDALKFRYPDAERLCEKVDARKLITLTPANIYHAPSVNLTKAGRNFVKEQGLDWLST